MTTADLLLERIHGVRGALAKVRAAHTSLSALGATPANLANLKKLAAMEHELTQTLVELRAELRRHQVHA